MRKFHLIFFILLITVGCTQKDEIEQLTIKYEEQLEEQQKIIEELREEIEEKKLVPDGSYRSSLQEADREARKIMQLIAEKKFDELKKEYNIDFEVNGDEIDFGVPEWNLPFPIEWVSNFMYIANFIKHDDGRMDISYFITNSERDKSELIHLSFGADLQFKFIFVGDA